MSAWPDPEIALPREPPNRRELVESLLVMYHEHGCCADPEMVEVLEREARAVGWVVPS